jgi:hypothetical protein
MVSVGDIPGMNAGDLSQDDAVCDGERDAASEDVEGFQSLNQTQFEEMLHDPAWG